MKAILVCVVIVLLGINGYLAINQQQLTRKVAVLESANRDLTAVVDQKPDISTDELRETRRQLEQAQMTLAATEKIITNLAPVLSQVPGSPAQMAASRSGQSSRFTAPRAVSGVPGGIEGLAQPPAFLEPGMMSSSHSAEGQLLQRSWGPEQLVGPPNTQDAGDYATAWAPKTSRGAGEEWIHLAYDNAVELAQVNVRETYNPGAISKIAAVLPNGQETVLWEGVEPASQAPVNMSFSLPAGVQANQIKVYLDRRRVPGWNEIDAVELVGRDGSRQWATSAMASSSYAEPR
jgi:hypothetical protein